MSYVAKIKLNNQVYPISPTLYGECNTDADVAKKTVVISDFDIPIKGSDVTVKFTNVNSADNPTLEITNGGAYTYEYPIYAYGTTPPGNTSETSWFAGSVVTFVFDDSYQNKNKENGAWLMKDWSSNSSGDSSLDSLIYGVNEGYYTFDSDNTGNISMTGELECSSLSVDGYFTAGGTSVYDLYVSASATISGNVSTDQDLSVTGYSTFYHQIRVPDIVNSDGGWDPGDYQESLKSTINDIYSELSSIPTSDNDKVKQVPISSGDDSEYPLLLGYTTSSTQETNYAHKSNKVVVRQDTGDGELFVYNDSGHSLCISGNNIEASGYQWSPFYSISGMASTLGYLCELSDTIDRGFIDFDITYDQQEPPTATGVTLKIEGDITPMSGYWDSQDKYKSLVDMAEDLANMSGGGGSSILDNYITVNTSNHTINYPSGYAVTIGDVSIYPDTGDIYPTSGTWGYSNYDSLIGMADDLQSVVGAADLAYAMDNDKIYVDRGTGAITVQNTTQAVTVSRTDITKATYWNTTDQIASLQATIDDLYSKISALESRLPAQS